MLLKRFQSARHQSSTSIIHDDDDFPSSAFVLQALHFAATCLEGTNLGPAAVLMLQEAGLVHGLADYFKLTEASLFRVI